MRRLVKLTMPILFLIFQNIFADICDFEYTGDYYDRDFGTCSSLAFLKEVPGTFCNEEYGTSPYEKLTTINKPDTTIDIFPDGTKLIIIRTLIKEGCIEEKVTGFDSLDNFVGSYGFVEKDNNLLQVTLNNNTLNINYIEAPCSFSVIDSSGKSIDFHFNGLENDIEYEKLEKKFPNITHLLSGQVYECRLYKRYIDFFNSEQYQEHLKEMDLIIKSIKSIK